VEPAASGLPQPGPQPRPPVEPGKDAAAKEPGDPTGPRRMRRLVVTAIVATAVAVAGLVGLAVTAATRHDGSDASGAQLPPASSTLGDGARAPVDFTLARLGGGSALSLARVLDGRPAVVNFFASWCSECAAELDAFGQAWRTDHGQVVFLGIDTNDTDGSKALALLRAAGAAYPVAVDDADDEVTDAYGVNGLPTTFFIDAEGRVRFEVIGAEQRGALERRIRALTGTR